MGESVNAQLRALAHDRRRKILQFLANAEEDGIELIGEVWPRETKDKDVRIALKHQHLPVLEQCNLIRYEDNRIYRGRDFDKIKPILKSVEEA